MSPYRCIVYPCHGPGLGAFRRDPQCLLLSNTVGQLRVHLFAKEMTLAQLGSALYAYSVS